MNTAASKALFALVESFFISYLPRQRGASPHTTRAYRDALKLLFQFVAQHRGGEIADRNVSTTLRQPAFEFKLGFSAFGLAG
jgi:site-specific recombinase XerC